MFGVILLCYCAMPYQKELLFILSCQKHLVGGRGIIPLLINFMNLLPHMGIWSMKAKEEKVTDITKYGLAKEKGGTYIIGSNNMELIYHK